MLLDETLNTLDEAPLLRFRMHVKTSDGEYEYVDEFRDWREALTDATTRFGERAVVYGRPA